MMDENAKPTFYEDANTGQLYQVLSILKSSTNLVSLLSEDEDYEDSDELDKNVVEDIFEKISNRNSISQRTLSLFLDVTSQFE